MNIMKNLTLFLVLMMVLSTGVASAETLKLVQKNTNTWVEVTGGATATLNYTPSGQTFDFTLDGNVPLNVEYALIYYADKELPPTTIPGVVGKILAFGTPNVDGIIHMEGSKVMKSIPYVKDANNLSGAKIWLVPASNINMGAEPKILNWANFATGGYLYEENLRAGGVEQPATSHLITYTFEPKYSHSINMCEKNVVVGGSWGVCDPESGVAQGVFSYETMTGAMNFEVTANKLTVGKDYTLLYYKDTDVNHVLPSTKPVNVLGTGIAKEDRTLIIDRTWTNGDIPAVDDINPRGKIWLVPTNEINGDGTLKWTGYGTGFMPEYLLESDREVADINPDYTAVQNKMGGIKIDITAPVIILLGNTPIDVEVGSVYADAGATALDNLDGDLTGSIVTVNSVNTAVLGTYTITYDVTDVAGNSAEVKTRTVNVVDTIAPVITLVGMNPVIVEVGSTYVDAGTTVTDNSGELLTATPTSDVNTTVLGIYTVTYNVADSSGNNAISVTRTVNVIDSIKPMITLNGDSYMDVAAYSIYVDAGATVTDNYYTGIVAVVTETTVDTTTAGLYTVTYNAVDGSGNSAETVIRTVHVYSPSNSGTTLSGWNIKVFTPMDGRKYDSQEIYMDYYLTYDEISYAGNVFYKLDDEEEVEMLEEYNTIKLGELSEGEHTVVIYVTDLNSEVDEILTVFSFEVDVTAPAEVEDLMHYDITSSSITWAWNNPSDEDFAGTVITVTMNGDPNPVYAAVDGEYMSIDQVHVGSNSEVTQEVVISGLKAGTTYTILVQTEDNAETQGEEQTPT